MKISETDNQVGDDGRDVEIERLKRKCDELRARERRANAEAKEARQNLARLLSASKAFASSMRDRTAERGRFQRRLAAQYAVSRVLAQTDDLKEAAPGILNTFGDGFGWDLGALWTLDKEAGVLRCDEVRRSPGSTLSRGFEAACRRASFPRGAGLPGRVWASGKALCVEDFLAGDDVRAEAADGEGPRRAFAFPIQDRNFLAVLEFFGSDAWPPDEELLQTATLIHDQIGQFIRRRRAEEALRENEKRFRAFFDTAAVGMAQTSFASGRFLRVNDKLCRLLGYDEDELLSMTLLQVTHPDDRARDAEGLSQLLRGEIREYVTEKKYLRKDGRIVWADLAVALLRDEDGHPLHTVTVIQDATERKLAEEALRESEERYKALYENNPSMYFTLDLDGTVLSVNRFGAEHLGYTVEELLGRPVINVFHEEDREGVSRHFRECLQDPGRTSGWEARKVCKDGSVLWVRENVRVARDPYGDMIVLVACEDITEHKQA
jgi:PAS domain S-box-containing protein